MSHQTYKLNTSLQMPHMDSITSIGFTDMDEDQNLKCVTVANDKKFKICHKIAIEEANSTI